MIVTLSITNTTAAEITGVRIVGERGDPIGNQAQLDSSIANPVAPASGLPIPSHPALQHLDLQPGTTTVAFNTSTSTIDNHTGICICATAAQPLIYPLFFSAHQVIDGVDNLLGLTATYLPIFYTKPQPIRVSWIWPLLEVPHRFLDDTVFTDERLATSVSTGRLSRALAVVEQVGGRIPLTLLIDPELLDELKVMAAGQYTVLARDGKSTPGTGQSAAAAWLDRLHTVLQNDPNVTVRLTPYADPDVETLSERGLAWETAMPAAMAARVTAALVPRPLDTSLAWPVSGTISRPTLRQLTEHDVNTLVLNSSAVRVRIPRGASPPSLVRLKATAQVAAALLSPTIERYAAKAISVGGEGPAAIPLLVSQLAVRAAEQPDLEQSVTIAAPRYVDPDVAAAVRTIQETSQSTFAEPTALADAVSTSTLVSTQTPELGKVLTANLPATLQAANSAASGLELIRSLLDTAHDPGAAALVATLPAAIQRAESSAWRDPVNLPAAARYARLMDGEINRLTSGVQLVTPSSRSYTLASNSSPLPITISNTLPYAVHVRVKIVPRNTTGFSVKDPGVESIEANQTRTIYIPATTERSGRFQIDVLLQAPDRRALGEASTLSVRSTALGFIGVIITVVAGVVLVIALLWRIVRRMRSRGAAGRPPAAAMSVHTPESVS